MEEPGRGRQPSLRVERAFASSRLEQQILVRAYELAVPIICKRTDAFPSAEQFRSSGSDSFQTEPIAKGA